MSLRPPTSTLPAATIRQTYTDTKVDVFGIFRSHQTHKHSGLAFGDPFFVQWKYRLRCALAQR
jgi:hypothetical protein